jgi:hypothetical protein
MAEGEEFKQGEDAALSFVLVFAGHEHRGSGAALVRELDGLGF